MTPGNYGASERAIGRRLSSEDEKILPEAGSQDQGWKIAEKESRSELGKVSDPLGMREAWPKTRKAIKELAVRRKSHDGDRKFSRKQIPDAEEPTMVRIREKMRTMREDMKSGLGGLDRQKEVPETRASPTKDPPDKGGGIARSDVEERDHLVRNTSTKSLITMLHHGSDREGTGTKDRGGEETDTQSTLPSLASAHPKSMAGRESKDKSIVEVESEAPRPGDGSSTARVLLRGDSSRGQEGRATLRRLGAGASTVIPRFPVNLGTRRDGVVELDLTKERAAMKNRWIAVGLYFSPLPYSNEGLIGNLKNKWGLRGHLDYKPLKNNRFLLEFEREGDRRFILDNGPWTYNGDAFLMVANDGGKPPNEVEVAHMPIWVRIHDVPPDHAG